MGIWIELGVFALALAFGLWQIRDANKAREESRRQREREAARQGQQAPEEEANGPSGPPA